MGPTTEMHCSQCATATTHWLVARTTLHLGTKRKWECNECEYRVVTVNDTILVASG